MLVPSRNVIPSWTPRSWPRSSSRSHTPRWAQRMKVCAARDQGPSSAGMARHLAPFACRQTIAESVRRKSFGAVLPLGRHASISGSRSLHAPSVSIAPPPIRRSKTPVIRTSSSANRPYSMSNIDDVFRQRFGTYDSFRSQMLNGSSLSQAYSSWSTTQRDTIASTLKTANLTADQLTADGNILKQLQDQSASADGQNASPPGWAFPGEPASRPDDEATRSHRAANGHV